MANFVTVWRVDVTDPRLDAGGRTRFFLSEEEARFSFPAEAFFSGGAKVKVSITEEQIELSPSGVIAALNRAVD